MKSIKSRLIVSICAITFAICYFRRDKQYTDLQYCPERYGYEREFISKCIFIFDRKCHKHF